MLLPVAREALYQDIRAHIGNTPLVRYEGPVHNGNSIFLKRECDNPFGSHYDRVYIDLFKHFEEQGLQPGSKVFETTSGAAGVSFAGIGKELGYECYVALPAGGEKAREEAIKKQLPSEDHLLLTPKKTYISGFPTFIKKFLVQNRDCIFLNHSMGRKGINNEVTLQALAGIAKEVMVEAEMDFFLPAIGNGSSVLGPGRVFHETHTRTIPFETFESAVVYDQLYPGEYQKAFGIKPGSMDRHKLPGTSFHGIDFPHIRNAIEEGIIEDVVLVSGEKTDAEFEELTGKTDTTVFPHWDDPTIESGDLGRTGRAGIAVANQLALRFAGKDFLVIAYDKADRYDS